jgi:hypothetical protein
MLCDIVQSLFEAYSFSLIVLYHSLCLPLGNNILRGPNNKSDLVKAHYFTSFVMYNPDSNIPTFRTKLLADDITESGVF